MRHRKQFYSQYGMPIAHGLLYVDSQKAFLDPSYTIHANDPMVLDSFGRVEFYTLNPVIYRLVNFQGVTMKTIEHEPWELVVVEITE